MHFCIKAQVCIRHIPCDNLPLWQLTPIKWYITPSKTVCLRGWLCWCTEQLFPIQRLRAEGLRIPQISLAILELELWNAWSKWIRPKINKNEENQDEGWKQVLWSADIKGWKGKFDPLTSSWLLSVVKHFWVVRTQILSEKLLWLYYFHITIIVLLLWVCLSALNIPTG